MKIRRILGCMFICMLMGVILSFSHAVYADETTVEKDFNKKKSVSITKKETYSASGKYVWIKYQPTEDGYLTVEAKDDSVDNSGATGYIALFNSTKSTAYSTKNIYYNTKSAKAYWTQNVFGLQKDQVYYLRVKAESPVTLTRTYTKVDDKSGTLRTAGYKLKKKKSVTGLITAGSSVADWYTITLKKKQKIRLYYNTKTYGGFKISIYTNNRCLGSYTTSYTEKQQKLTISQYKYSTGKKLPMAAGTYYIKVEKVNSKSSGYYKLKWK